MRYRSTEIKELTAAMLVSLARRIDPEHRAELLRTYPNLTAWARSRLSLPGSAWACIVGGEVVFILGLATYGAGAWVWLAGAKGWARYVKHAGHLWRSVMATGLYKKYICDVRADNLPARHFAEYAGFKVIEQRGDVVYYGMAT
jgi:hypothetical protein